MLSKQRERVGALEHVDSSLVMNQFFLVHYVYSPERVKHLLSLARQNKRKLSSLPRPEVITAFRLWFGFVGKSHWSCYTLWWLLLVRIEKSPRASIKIPLTISRHPQFQHRIPSFILFLLNWAFAPLHVSASMHGHRAESCISLCAIWWEPSGVQADFASGGLKRGWKLTDNPALPCVCVRVPPVYHSLAVCTGRGIHLQYKLLIWLLIADPRLWNRVAASLDHLAILIILNIHVVKQLLLVTKSGHRFSYV